MPRKFITADYEATLNRTIRLGDALPPAHLARFVVAAIAQLDLSQVYRRYGKRGGTVLAPELLLGLLFYGYATGVFSSRKLEQATYESLPLRFLAGEHHPDHDTIAHFRKTFLPELKDLFGQLLLSAHLAGVLTLGNVSVDGTKIHADASKSQAVSYKHLLELEQRLQAEVETLFALGEQADQAGPPPAAAPAGGSGRREEIARRQGRLAKLAHAKAVLAERAQVRSAVEQAAYETKVQAREERARQTGRPPRGRAPTPPPPGPRDKDQYNFTDPDSRIMKNSTNAGFEQDYNAQVAVEHTSLLIVATTLSNQPTDQGQALPTVDAIPPELGRPPAAALDNGYWSPQTIDGLVARGIDPYIATGRDPHHRPWHAYLADFADPLAPPLDGASLRVRMAYRLQTEIGHAIYRLRKCTVEPVIGIIKEVLGFRQFSLRGGVAAAGEWCLVCLAFNLKRLPVLLAGRPLAALGVAGWTPDDSSPTGC